MHAIVAGVFQGCCSRAVQGKSGDLKTGDEVHIPVGSQTALGGVLWALASHGGSFRATLAAF